MVYRKYFYPDNTRQLLIKLEPNNELQFNKKFYEKITFILQK